MTKENWVDINPDFAKKHINGTYQQEWEWLNLDYQDAKEWISTIFKPNDYKEVSQWKNHNFTFQEVESWIDTGSLKKCDAEFSAYLRNKGYQPNSDSNLKQAREEFDSWKEEKKSVQEYLDVIFPKNKRKEIKELVIFRKNFQGESDLSDFVNLRSLDCRLNEITSLNLSGCSNLVKLECCDNNLTNLILPKQVNNLKKIWLRNNNFNQDLTFLEKAVNLEELALSNNKFYGSLKYLKKMEELNYLNISDTDIDRGLEYLSESIKDFECSVNRRSSAKIIDIYEELLPFEKVKGRYLNGDDGGLKAWRKAKIDKQFSLNISSLLPPQLISKIKKGNKFRENYGIPNTNYNEIHFNQWTEKRSSLEKELPTKLYNIQEKQVERTEGQAGKYAILSYVWGNPGQTSKEIIEKYELKKVEDKKLNISGNKALYKAIRAIKAINEKRRKGVQEQNPDITEEELKNLDINHLWMDQLCIDQTNTADKNQEVPKMRQYYSNADYTLISINTELGDISDVDMMDILKAIVRSEWFTRSWTYQEGWLSKHTIFMFDDKLIDGRAMAGTWALNQLGYVGEGKYNSRREFDKGTKKIATPVGWTYFRDGYNENDKVTMTLTQALKEIKTRGRGVPVDGIYSILGLLPYGEHIPVKYKSRVCPECPNQEEIADGCNHEEKNKKWPVYTKEDLEKVLYEVMRFASEEDDYAEPIAWHGSGTSWLPTIDEKGSTNIEGGIRVKIEFNDWKMIVINFSGEGVEIQVVKYQILKVDSQIHKRESGFEVEGGLYERKVWVENNIEVTLLGTKKTMELIKEGVVLAIPRKEYYQSIKPFALLLKDAGKGDVYCRLGLVELGAGIEKLQEGKKMSITIANQGQLTELEQLKRENQELRAQIVQK